MRLIKFIFRDKVDLIILFVVIAFLIRDFERYAFLGIIVLYIIGVMYRMGIAMENLDLYVTNADYRKKLKLYPLIGFSYKPKGNTLSKVVEFIFWAALVGMLAYWAIHFTTHAT